MLIYYRSKAYCEKNVIKLYGYNTIMPASILGPHFYGMLHISILIKSFFNC